MEEEVLGLEKVRKNCNTASIVVKLLMIFCIVGTVLALAGGIYCLAGGERLETGILAKSPAGRWLAARDGRSIRVGGFLSVAIDISPAAETGMYARRVAVECFMGAAICLVAAVIFFICWRIFSDIRNGASPFAATVVSRLKTNFIILTAAVVLLVNTGFGIILGVFLWCCHTIFQYGRFLQKQADETL